MPSDENPNSLLWISSEDRIARIRLNCPEQRNRLSPRMTSALLKAIRSAQADPDARCILLQQCVAVFCAGADHDSINEPGAIDDLHALLQLRHELRKPLLAAVAGGCAGAGVGLLLQCHLVLAAQGARFSVNEIHSAIWPALYYSSLADAFGSRRACELALTGRVFSAADALACGLIHEIVPPFELEDRALQLAATLASLSPSAVASGLEFAARCRAGQDAAQSVEWFRSAALSRDFLEAVAAAREQRRPVWHSRIPEQ